MTMQLAQPLSFKSLTDNTQAKDIELLVSLRSTTSALHDARRGGDRGVHVIPEP